MNSLQGHFLVASPHLGDINFFHTVVLMIQHDEEGAFGVVLNRPTSESVLELWQAVSDEPCRRQEAVREGGPVPGPPLLLHKNASLSQFEILPGLHMASQRGIVGQLLADEQEVLFFTGYSGWSAGQLESELEAGGWLHAPATLEIVFSEVDEMWKQVVEQIGLDILRESIPDLPATDNAAWN